MTVDRERWRAAYEAAHYAADLGGGMELRVGQRHPELDDALDGQAWCLLQATNPGGQRLDAAGNALRHQALGGWLEEEGLAHWPAAGFDPEGKWGTEPGFLVAGVDRGWALAACRRWGQNAVLFGERSAVAILLWADDD